MTSESFEQLMARAGLTVPDELPTFDAWGLPLGRSRAEFLAAWAGALDEELEERGWDAPPCFLVMYGPQATQVRSGARVEASLVGVAAEDVDTNVLATLYRSEFLEVPEAEHPIEQLWGMEIPEDAAALVVVTENWVGSSTGVRPSLDPKRREMRSIVVIARSGEVLMFERYRGSDHLDPKPVDTVSGRMIEVARHVVGLPPQTTPITPAQMWGRAVMAGVNAVRPMLLEQTGQDTPVGILVRGGALAKIVDLAEAGVLDVDDEDEEDLEYLTDLGNNGAPDAPARIVRLARKHLAPMMWQQLLAVPDIMRPLCAERLPLSAWTRPQWASEGLVGALVAEELVPLPKLMDDLPHKQRRAARVALEEMGLL